MAKRIVYPTVEEIIAINKRIVESRKPLTPKELKRAHKKIDAIIGEIKKFWKGNPRMRLGQLLENYIFTKGERGDKTSQELYYQSDKETEKILKKLNRDHKAGKRG